MTSEPQIFTPGIRAADIELVETRRDGALGRFRSPVKKVPGLLKPTRDQMVVLYGGTVGVVPLDWGERPDPDTAEWREADRAALLRRDWREEYSVKAPSKSPDLEFDVVVEWTYTLTSAHTYMMELNGTSSTVYRDLVDRIVREKASISDARDPEELRIALDSKLTPELNVRNDLVPGVETRFGLVKVSAPEPAIEARKTDRTVDWERDHRTHAFAIDQEDQERAEEQRQVDVARGRSVIRDDEETELLHGQLRHERHRLEMEQRGAREHDALREDDTTQILSAELGHKRHKVEAGHRSEQDELEHRRLMIEANRQAERENAALELEQATAEIRGNLQLLQQKVEHIRLSARIEQNTKRQHLELGGEKKTAELQEGITDVRAGADLARLGERSDMVLRALKEPDGPVAWAIANGEIKAAEYVERAAANLGKEFERLYALIGEMFRSEVDDDFDMARLRIQVVSSELGRVFKSITGLDLGELSQPTAANRVRVNGLEIDKPDPEPAPEGDPDDVVVEAETVDEDD